MKKVVKAVVIGIGVAAVILAILKIVKAVKKAETESTEFPKFYEETDDESLGIS